MFIGLQSSRCFIVNVLSVFVRVTVSSPSFVVSQCYSGFVSLHLYEPHVETEVVAENRKFIIKRRTKATFTLLRFRLYPFLLVKTLSVGIAPFSNEYVMKTIGVHTVPAKWCC